MTEATPRFAPPSEGQEWASSWFEALRDRICAAFEAIEQDYAGPDADSLPPGHFVRTDWDRPGGGGGTMAVMRGRVFEKVGVNVSTVAGEFSAEFRKRDPGAAEDPRFWASGVSLVAHMRSPLVPAVHMNTRHIVTRKSWFGGGADLTPIYPDEEAAAEFHAALAGRLRRLRPGMPRRFKAWCDEYFYLPHRGEPRGAGGSFSTISTAATGSAISPLCARSARHFLRSIRRSRGRRMNRPWTAEQRRHQLVRRGRYVEFNLLYDRGTRFGLKTGGNVEAILMSLPPEAAWP